MVFYTPTVINSRSVCEFADVDDAGSGRIITNAERIVISTNTSNIATNTSNIATNTTDITDFKSGTQYVDAIQQKTIGANTSLTVDFTVGMVYYFIDTPRNINSLNFTNIPNTNDKCYTFTFIFKLAAAGSGDYIQPASITINSDPVTVTLIGGNTQTITPNTTLILQQVSIVRLTNSYIALTSVTCY